VVDARGSGARWSFDFCRLEPTKKQRACGSYSAFTTSCATSSDECVKIGDHVQVWAVSTAYGRDILSAFAEAAMTAVFDCAHTYPARVHLSAALTAGRAERGRPSVVVRRAFAHAHGDRQVRPRSPWRRLRARARRRQPEAVRRNALKSGRFACPGRAKQSDAQVEQSDAQVVLSDDQVEQSDDQVVISDDQVEQSDDQVELSDARVEQSDAQVE